MMKYIYLFFTALTFASLPMTHIHVAEKWIADFTTYNVKERQAFMLGTLFPDISYLGVIMRSEIYDVPHTLQDVYEARTPFQAGKLLHIYMDNLRFRLMKKWGVKSLLAHMSQEHINTFLELLEDELLYRDKSATTVRQFLSAIYEEEILSNIPVEALIKWHRILIRYLAGKPSVILQEICKEKEPYFGVPPEIHESWIEALPLLAKSEKIRQYVKDFIREIEKEFIIFRFSMVKES
jgi:hypothetical protein